MPDLKSPENIAYALALLVPGIVFMYCRAQFTTGRLPKAADASLQYFAITVAYYAGMLPAIGWATNTAGNAVTNWLGWVGIIFLLPAFLGFAFGISAQNEAMFNLLRKLGLNPVHSFPTAWDWKFARCKGEFVVVTMKDGTIFYGFCGKKSFISTEPTERDLFLEETYDIDKEQKEPWRARGCSLLVAGSGVSTLEFYPNNKGLTL